MLFLYEKNDISDPVRDVPAIPQHPCPVTLSGMKPDIPGSAALFSMQDGLHT